MDVASFIKRIEHQNFFENQIVHIKHIEPVPPVYRDVNGGLHPNLQNILAESGIGRLYSHQAESIELIRDNRNIVIVTGTASGKTMCYTIPVIEALLADTKSTMLFIYPTKALAQDQLRVLSRYQKDALGIKFMAGTYDGDTPQNLRRKIRDGGNIILTNPDMLHQGILPQHSRWNRLFTYLQYIVIDEVHAYRGVFGSHLANVMRRLMRICAHYGSKPQFICSSATIANPKEHAEKICGVPMELVDRDGSPKGKKHFVLWNPPPLKQAATGDYSDWRIGGDRRSPTGEAVNLMTALVKEGIQTIAFVQTRLAAELIFKDCRDRLEPVSQKLANAVHAYRGGYLPEERREIERRLAEKEILAVSSTNALEMGIDIGSLEACILVGYPGTIASLWQRAGRAGRGDEEAIIFLVAQNAPMDQFLMAHEGYLFERNPENAVIDPNNPHIVVGHIKCAVSELPLRDDHTEIFGDYAVDILELLEEDQAVRHIENNWYWASSEYPAANVNLRNISGPVYTIQDEADNKRIIGTIDEISAMSQLHNHAVYLHGADTFFVNNLDIEQKIAYVEKQELDYYTQSVQTSELRIDEKSTEVNKFGGILGFGDVTVSTSIPMFRKIRFHSRDSLGFEKLELPPQILETVALWFAPPEEIAKNMLAKKMLIGEALIGIANLLTETAPLFVMCDTQDIGTVVDAKNLNRDTVFLFDRYPGGMGYATRCLDRFDDIIRTIAEIIKKCSCKDGCPSCVGSAVTASSMTDIDSGVRGRIPNKKAAGFLLDTLL